MKLQRRISPVRVVSAGFVILILLGAFLLNTSFATADGTLPGFVNALFTATSAVCVTGLNVFNTGLYWSAFGKGIIICLIQIGGLGFMTVAALLSFAFRRKITLKERMVLAEALNRENLSGVVKLTSRVIIGTFIFEGLGAAVLTVRFAMDYPFWEALGKGVFHSISAFCNAGFDILGGTGDNGSLGLYRYDPTVNFTIMFLIIMGGLGFYVWTDIAKERCWKRFHTQTRIVLVVTGILTLGGALLIFLFEYTNVCAMSSMNPWQAVMASLFQSVTCRTAGFETIPQANFCLPTRLISVILMFIGGSPGSTAGGIKTVTFAVLVMSAVSVVRGREHTNLFKRRIKPEIIHRSVSVVTLALAVVIVSTVAICALESSLTLDEAMFEVVSAFATVGLTCGVTTSLGTASRLLLIVLMYFGRIGILTISMALAEKSDKSEDLYQYADAHISVG